MAPGNRKGHGGNGYIVIWLNCYRKNYICILNLEKIL